MPDARALAKHSENLWRESILPALHEYIRIPALSPAFEAGWETAGHIDQAVDLAVRWIEAQPLHGATVEVVRLPGRTPLLLVEVDGTAPGTALLYGHLDKQPPFEGWRTDEGLGPWTPVLRDDRLYGRGGADDGYSVFAAVGAVLALQAQGVAHPRIVCTIECSEESGSPDLPAYIDALATRIGTPDLVVCLDSGCGDYERLWWTTSLRGLVGADLDVRILTDGVHSGDAGGVVPSSFRIARILLDRIQDTATGRIRLEAFHAPIPPRRREQARAAAEVLGEDLWRRFPFVEGAHPPREDLTELVLDRTWRPALEVTGQDGIPPVEAAGNVLRPYTRLRLSLRLPPGVDPQAAAAALREAVTTDPPYGAHVEVHFEGLALGWEAPEEAPWLASSIDEASRHFFGTAPRAMGEGGSIPFMAMLGERFPEAQFLITGVLGPEANAHGPNEFLHVPTAVRLTGSVAWVLAALADHASK